jgi:hypothetical protein
MYAPFTGCVDAFNEPLTGPCEKIGSYQGAGRKLENIGLRPSFALTPAFVKTVD